MVKREKKIFLQKATHISKPTVAWRRCDSHVANRCIIKKNNTYGKLQMNFIKYSNVPQLFTELRYGLVVRIAGSHPAGPGSIPGNGTQLFFSLHAK